MGSNIVNFYKKKKKILKYTYYIAPSIVSGKVDYWIHLHDLMWSTLDDYQFFNKQYFFFYFKIK